MEKRFKYFKIITLCMVKKISSLEKKVSKSTSWIKIIFAVLAGIILGWISLSFNTGGIGQQTLMDFVILALLACVLALLLDIRRMIISCN